MDAKLFSLLTQYGYTNIREIGGKVYGLRKFLFSTELYVGLHASGYEKRYAYEYEAEARAALQHCDGKAAPGFHYFLEGGPAHSLDPEEMQYEEGDDGY